MTFLDKLPWPILIAATIFLGLAPFYNAQGEFEPHLVEKINMWRAGTLSRPIDIFDLVMHATPGVLLMLKVIRHLTVKPEAGGAGSSGGGN